MVIKKDVILLRHKLHQNPEVSNNEYKTSENISCFMKTLKPDEIITLSKTGKAFVFCSKKTGETLMFRAELDALPIIETSDLPYSSVNKGIAHSCGHDGHMAIICGLAQKIAENRPKKGKVVLLFQPAEEIEQGAKDIVESSAFKNIKTDYIISRG